MTAPPDRAPENPALPELLGQLTDEALDKRERARLLTRLIPLVAGRARSATGSGLRGPRQIGDIVVDLISDTVPRLPVRDLSTLRRHHGGLSDDALASSLVAAASKATAAVGAAGGVLAAVEFAAPPTLLSAPVQLAAETLAVVAIEVKLVAELHEVYGVIIPGNTVARGRAWLAAWAQRRGIDLTAPERGLTSVVSTAARRQLRSRLARRAGRNATSMLPLFLGAAAAGELNRRETRKLGEQISADLRPGRTKENWYDGWRR